MERMRAEREGGERGPPFRIAVVLFVFLNSMYLHIPQIMWPPLFPSLCISSAAAKHSVPCPLFYRPNRIYTFYH